ncbi:MAG: GIY-YIG nuclease family protein [Gammaproteobacteria bacterium]|jgi:putative endonuclease
MSWQVYMILCSDDSLYTGISTDALRRLEQHARRLGARYFRSRRPRGLVYLETGHSRSSASRREAAIKRLKRIDKKKLVDSRRNELGGRQAETLLEGRRAW